MVVPISEVSLEYARDVRRALRGRRLHCEVDESDRKMQKKVREAQLEQWNYILVRRLFSNTSSCQQWMCVFEPPSSCIAPGASA
jgi:Anticodon binding domain